MLRSATSRTGAGALTIRSLSTNPPTPTPTSAAPSPPPPSPAPSAGVMRRVVPLALASGTGYFVYKASSDDDFRKNVEVTIPGSATLLEYIPGPSMPPSLQESHATREKIAAQRSTSSAKHPADANLPQHYEPVPKILQQIEKVDLDSHHPDHPDLRLASSNIPGELEALTPSQRAAAKAKANAAGLERNTKGGLRTDASGVKAIEQLAMATPASATENQPVAQTESLEHVLQTSSADDEQEKQKETFNVGDSGEDDRPAIAKILGKGGFSTDKETGPDLLDKSEYEKPSVGSKVQVSRNKMSKGGRSEASSWWWSKKKKTSESGSILSVEDAASISEEISSLRAELESQNRWEAVRLQEAIRAQLTEDKKLAEKEVMRIAKKHAEEISRVRIEALETAENVLRDRTKEMREKTEREMETRLMELLKTKEKELRGTLTVEYEEKAKEESGQRQMALVEMKTHVKGLTDHFDALVKQTEKAKFAAEATMAAVSLNAALKDHKPLKDHLNQAMVSDEMSKTIVETIPKSAVEHGVYTVDELKYSFQSAWRKGLSAAMVPEGQRGTLWGHFLGAIFSRLKMPVDIRAESNQVAHTNEDKLRLAKLQVEEGDLQQAVFTLDKLDGLSRNIMKDWIEHAKTHLATETAATALLVQAVVAQAVLSFQSSPNTHK